MQDATATTLDCPTCSAPMQSLSVERKPIGSVLVEYCGDCRSLWFDAYEDLQLTAAATLELFRTIAKAKPETRRPIPSSIPCPRCSTVLVLTYDLQRATRFTYYRCQRGDGRLMPFAQFLREKDFIRPLAPEDLERLKASVRTIRCSGCGAPVDLATNTVCPYCRAPIEALDPDAVQKALQSLQQQKVAVEAPSDSDLGAQRVLAIAQVEKAYAQQRADYNAGFAVDLIGWGLSAVSRLLDPP